MAERANEGGRGDSGIAERVESAGAMAVAIDFPPKLPEPDGSLMVDTTLHRGNGGVLRNPSDSEIQETLRDVVHQRAEGVACWMSDESGWVVSVFGGGVIAIENAANREGPWHLPKQTSEDALFLWRALRYGDHASIRVKARSGHRRRRKPTVHGLQHGRNQAAQPITFVLGVTLLALALPLFRVINEDPAITVGEAAGVVLGATILILQPKRVWKIPAICTSLMQMGGLWALSGLFVATTGEVGGVSPHHADRIEGIYHIIQGGVLAGVGGMTRYLCDTLDRRR